MQSFLQNSVEINKILYKSASPLIFSTKISSFLQNNVEIHKMFIFSTKMSSFPIGRATEVWVGWGLRGSANPRTLAEKCCMGGWKRASPRKLSHPGIIFYLCKGLRGPRRPLQTLARL